MLVKLVGLTVLRLCIYFVDSLLLYCALRAHDRLSVLQTLFYITLHYITCRNKVFMREQPAIPQNHPFFCDRALLQIQAERKRKRKKRQ